jgi:hypothetical protein
MRRRFSSEFKAKVALAATYRGKTLLRITRCRPDLLRGDLLHDDGAGGGCGLARGVGGDVVMVEVATVLVSMTMLLVRVPLRKVLMPRLSCRL